jgi:hypothetical protein
MGGMCVDCGLCGRSPHIPPINYMQKTFTKNISKRLYKHTLILGIHKNSYHSDNLPEKRLQIPKR